MILQARCEDEVSSAEALITLGPKNGGSIWTAPENSLGPALVVEDDPMAQKYLRLVLQKAGFSVAVAGSGEEAMELFAQQPPRLVLLDIGLPGIDGFRVCQLMRKRRADVAIVMLTGRGCDADYVSGLEHGADLYLVKPFESDVQMLGIKALLRRCTSQASASDALILGDLRLEFPTSRVFKNGEELNFTRHEFTLLAAFLKHPGEVLTRAQLMEQVWGANHASSPKALDVLVFRLREKLEENPARPTRLKTEWGVGYRFD